MRLLAFFVLLAATAHGQLTGAVGGTHDPAIGEDHGRYYVFATGNARPGQLPIRCSPDLVNWTRCGAVFSGGVPAWITALSPATRDLWAPDVSFFDGLYHLYYVFSIFGKRTSGIALVTSPTLDPEAAVWTDRGVVLQTSERDDFNAIDPNVILDERGDLWMVFGSYWSGIKLRRLDRATGLLDPREKKQYSLAARAEPDHAIEAPFLFRHDGFYYLFVSWDRCCIGAASTYRTMVGRSEKITGPYRDRDGKKMIDGGGTEVLTGTARTVAANGHGNAPSPPPTAQEPVRALDSQRRAMEIYPDLATPGSTLNHTFVAMVHQLTLEHSPRLQQPDWPEQVATQCATALLIKPVPRKAPPVSPAPAARPRSAATSPDPRVGTASTTVAAIPLAAAPATALAPVAALPPSAAPVAALPQVAALLPTPPPISTAVPMNAMFIAMDADYTAKLNTFKYHEHGAPQEATVEVKLRSMMRESSKFLLRCVFFKRPTGHGDRRTVLSKEEKHIELAAGENSSASFASPPVYRGRHATEEFDGWLVQLFPEGSEKFLRQIGSTGTIEELGKTAQF